MTSRCPNDSAYERQMTKPRNQVALTDGRYLSVCPVTHTRNTHLDIALLASRQVPELRRVVVDVRDQDVDAGGGVASWAALVGNHDLQRVLVALLPIQLHPVDKLACARQEVEDA